MIERACADCGQEHGVPSRPNVSHGYCRRHWIKRAIEADMTAQEIADKLMKYEDKWAPDLNQQGG